MRTTAWRQFRIRLASADAAIAHACLGVFAGVVTGLVMLVFRFAIEWPASQYLPGGIAENFEGLAPQWRFLLPVLGALVVGLWFQRLQVSERSVGVAHVIDSLHGNGKLAWKNALAQFIGSSIALSTGASGGREGPAVHLGAASSSLLGKRLYFPNNSLRVLAACGAASAIAASFNTPIAGVIFAMEVVMLEYTVAGFIPVMLAAVCATALTQAVHGNEIFLASTQANMQSLYDLPFIALLGLLCALLSTAFVKFQAWCFRIKLESVVLRFTLAGLLTGSLALIAPQILGTGYDSFSATFAGQFSLGMLLLLIVAKLLATAASSGLGLPIGIIGPSLLIGAFTGAALGSIGLQLMPDVASGADFYALLGMAALMAALMNAPLAALLALVELTHNTAIIFPAMLVITIAQLCHRDIFKQASSPQTALKLQGRALRRDPLRQALLRSSVIAAMEKNIESLSANAGTQRITELAENHQGWLHIRHDSKHYLMSRREWLDHLVEAKNQDELDLHLLLASQSAVMQLAPHATLAEALDCMHNSKQSKILIHGSLSSGSHIDIGVITRDAIEAQYNRPPEF